MFGFLRWIKLTFTLTRRGEGAFSDKKKTLGNAAFPRVCGGRNRTRTCDPIDVNDVLYQLSHATLFRTFLAFSPKSFGIFGEAFHFRCERLASNLFTSTSLFREKVPRGTPHVLRLYQKQMYFMKAANPRKLKAFQP